MSEDANNPANLPPSALEYINLVIRKMGYRRKIRTEVKQELTDHFTDALADHTDPQARAQHAAELITQFGPPKLLARLIRRGKKRCRPLWKKVLIRTCQSIPLLLALFIIYTAWFLTGKPTISTDYLTQLSRLMRPNVPDSQNAWPEYQKAALLYVKPDESIAEVVDHTSRYNKPRVEFIDLDSDQQQALITWLNQNQPAWEQFHLATRKPHCWRHLQLSPEDYRHEGLIAILLLPHLGEIRQISKLALWHACVALTHEDAAGALDYLLPVARTGHHLQGKGFLIEQLVGMAISNLAHTEIVYLLRSAPLSAQQLTRLQTALFELCPQGFPTIDFEAEKIAILDMVQHSFTKGGPGGGHIVPAVIPSPIELWESYVGPTNFDFDDMLVSRLVSLLALTHAGRDETVAKVLELYARYDRQKTMTPYQKHSAPIKLVDQLIQELPKHRFRFVQFLMPALDRACDISFRGKALHDATITIIALKRYQLETGSYPPTLQHLVDTGSLAELPDDPYSNGPLRYELRNSDFILYSFAGDFDDDHGRYDPQDPWVNSADANGDYVFWPPPSPASNPPEPTRRKPGPASPSKRPRR